jgi:hypothetical protein
LLKKGNTILKGSKKKQENSMVGKVNFGKSCQLFQRVLRLAELPTPSINIFLNNS